MQAVQDIVYTREVIYIDANPELLKKKQKQLRVAAYCRVSTDSEEQSTSYETQQSHYREKIHQNKNWRLVDIFAEEVSGTRADKRVEFQKMISKCRKKKIDLVITKSISRFARNTVDCLEYIRELKSLGIGIIFEKENINTLDATSEVIMTILSSLAQEESNSISANIKMGKRMRAKDGKVPFIKTYGYHKDKQKNVTVIPEQAEVVKMIYKAYLAGNSEGSIKKMLEENAIPSPTKKETWNVSTIQGIISNEKYCGDILTQKTIVLDPISKKVVKNEGQLPKVLIKNNHIPIISRELFEKTQLEIARRSSKQKVSSNAKTELSKYSSKYALTEILVCGECNTPYKRTTWARNGVKKIVWRCISRLENGVKYCKDSPTINENDLHQAIIDAMNETKLSRQILIDYLIKKIETGYTKKDNSEEDIKNLETQIMELKKSAMDIVRDNTQNPNAENLTVRLTEINDKMKLLTITLNELKKSIAANGNLEQKLLAAREILSDIDGAITTYDDSITRQCIEEIRVIDKNRIHITFKDGYEYEKTLNN